MKVIDNNIKSNQMFKSANTDFDAAQSMPSTVDTKIESKVPIQALQMPSPFNTQMPPLQKKSNSSALANARITMRM